MYINIVSLIISTIIFSNINLFLSNLNQTTAQETIQDNIEIKQENPSQTEDNNQKQETNENNTQDTAMWQLEIPAIGLKAPIEEGTTKEVMDKYIGHFEETSKNSGNIGLVAHNRGFENNYFANLKKLKKGDIITYYCNGAKREYQVEIIAIIKDTDWSYLEETEDNAITLITCVEGQPEYRRCIQGKERNGTKIE